VSECKIEKSAEYAIKELIGDPRDRVKLDEYVTSILRKAIETVSADAFWNPLPEPNADGIQQRLTKYEDTLSDLLPAVILLGRWGQADQVMLFEKVLLRLAESNKTDGGLVVWQCMRWYSICLLAYAAGIAALSARNYPMLGAFFRAQIISPESVGVQEALVVKTLNKIHKMEGAFKTLPAHARHRVPRSEYIFDILRPSLDRILFLGESYERLFDEFELISALVYADLTSKERARIWAMPGRFGYKSQAARSVIQMFMAEAKNAGREMPLLKLGLFDSSATRFEEVAKGYLEFLSNLHWH
jgi:hypothetical protein